MATPTAMELRTLVRLGIAMPDGSYYVRNADDLNNAILAVGRAKPADGQTAEERRMEVRRHIIKRASKLKLSDKIPDTWNPDGSLKHMDLEDFIQHYGVKGMHWRSHKHIGVPQPQPKGPHLKPDAAPGQGRLAKLTPEQRKFQMDRLTQHLADLKKQRAADPKGFKGHNNILRAQARLTVLERQHAEDQKRQNAKKNPTSGGTVPKLRGLPPRAQHSDDGEDFLPSEEVQEVIEHFGRKGMKWGEHRFGPDRGGYSTHVSSSSDHTAARAAQTKAKAHGTHVLSNEELKTLTERLNLEASYKRLTETQGNYEKGKGWVDEIVSAGKLGLDAYNTGKRIYDTVNGLKKKA